MTQCNQSLFEFAAHFSRQAVVRFDGGTHYHRRRWLLLREADRQQNLLPRLARCFVDRRNPLPTEHSVQEMVSQRVYALAVGYEDLNDPEQLRQDPVLRLLAGKAEVDDQPLAGKSTLNRLELNDGTASRYSKITCWRDALDELLVNIFLEAHTTAPDQIVLDVDTTDVELHGGREGRCNRRLLEVERVGHDSGMSGDSIQNSGATGRDGRRQNGAGVEVRPTAGNGLRLAPTMFHHRIDGFCNRDLRQRMADLWGVTLAEQTAHQTTHDLRRLRLKGSIYRPPKANGYFVTPVFRPAMATFTAKDAVLTFPPGRTLDRVDQQLDLPIYDAFPFPESQLKT
jgi:hypothetical protein